VDALRERGFRSFLGVVRGARFLGAFLAAAAFLGAFGAFREAFFRALVVFLVVFLAVFFARAGAFLALRPEVGRFLAVAFFFATLFFLVAAAFLAVFRLDMAFFFAPLAAVLRAAPRFLPTARVGRFTARFFCVALATLSIPKGQESAVADVP
jgi:hypothetical protein